MKNELDELLCKRYPKIFANRHGDMKETLMCWGFECGDGWFNIIDKMCANIQWHIDTTRDTRLRALKYNRALKAALEKNDISKLEKFYSIRGNVSDWSRRQIEEDLEKAEYREVPVACPQVVAIQVKEKFGTLRFYYSGGDTFTYAVDNMAESMSAVTCEICGDVGKVYRNGWHTTLCKKHAEEQGREEPEESTEKE